MSDATAFNSKYVIKSLCVFCGSKTGSRPEYAAGTRALANEMVKRNIGLVYGGGNVGLMGVVRSCVVEGGGTVLGIIPQSLSRREITGVVSGGKNIIVDTMHERKLMMYKEADGFIAIPGGYGTLDELMEIVTWSQLGIHAKPIGLLNIEGYFDPLLEWVKKATEEGFITAPNQNIFFVASDPSELLDKFEAFAPRPSILDWDIRV